MYYQNNATLNSYQADKMSEKIPTAQCHMSEKALRTKRFHVTVQFWFLFNNEY